MLLIKIKQQDLLLDRKNFSDSIAYFTRVYTSTLWNTTECCRGFEDMKDEISSSLKASNIFALIFY